MKSLTICYITARQNTCFRWMIDSLRPQLSKHDPIKLVVVDALASTGRTEDKFLLADLGVEWVWTEPKPTVWQGAHRLTKDQWWAASNARNTGICLCDTDWIAFLDDRCVLVPTWLQAVRDAMAGNYAVCGSYEKRHGMKVENGHIVDGGKLDGSDPRSPQGKDHRDGYLPGNPVAAPGSWWFGCTNALPVEWALQVNGYEELMDGLSFEDCIFGMMLERNKYPIKFDARMKIIEDRTPGELGEPMKRSSKERWPNDTSDKGHEALRRFGSAICSQHQWNLRAVREQVLKGEPFPVPTGPERDWFDKQLLSEM